MKKTIEEIKREWEQSDDRYYGMDFDEYLAICMENLTPDDLIEEV